MNRKCQWSWIERRWSISSSNVNRRVNWESPLFDLIENKSRGGRKFLECRWIVLYVLLIVVRFYQIKFSFPLTLWRGEIYIVAKDRLEITYHKIFCVHEKDVNSKQSWFKIHCFSICKWEDVRSKLGNNS